MTVKKAILSFILSLIFFSRTGFSVDTKEMQFGFAQDRKVLSEKTVVLDYALSDRINKIGNRVVRASDRPDMKYTFRVLNDPTINAFSAAGGFVYINTGLLDVLESEEQLAAVLAHEIGHVSKQHVLKSIRKRRATSDILSVSMTAALATAAAYAVGPGASQLAPPQRDDLMKGLGELSADIGMRLGEEMALVIAKGYNKQLELDADALAIRYANKAGYDPNALVSTFKIFVSIRDRLKINENNYVSSLINAKPGLEERIKQAEKLISKTK